ncbi:MAG TPA: hypothetical protein PLE45_03175 [Spirochaetota bacterium]|nr:hypothetical protein [Spirochaetota bacterium]HOL56198.1 hypothetical protein [Spirochaetota bacterium]HPP03815.1 hypothetical protein [Spirochaetota bacterium]
MKKFEFVIGEDLYQKIKNLDQNKNISKIIRELLIKMIPFITKKHLTEPRRKKDYPVVNATRRVRVFLKDNLYNHLKVIHDNLNTFSMATIVREILEEYFVRLLTYGEEGFEKIIKENEKEIEEMRKNKAKVSKMGNDIPRNFIKQSVYLLYLDDYFCLTEFHFL